MPATTGGCSVIQGYFPRGVPAFPNSVPPRNGGVMQPRMAAPPPRPNNGTAIPLPEHLARFSGGGQPLPAPVRQKMEAAFSTSFADVRIHVGREAQAIGAVAFTQGSHIHFAAGQYDPHTPAGQKIIGHELTHVVQQRAGRVRNPFGSGVAIVRDAALEAEAERMGARAAAAVATAQPKMAPVVQRAESKVAVSSSSSSSSVAFTRTAPIELGIHMASARADGKAHAQARIRNTAWMIASMLLMKKRGEIDAKDVASAAKVDLQHGRGDVGTQAAHHIILTPAITSGHGNARALHEIVPAHSPLRLLLVMQQSQTTILPIVYNVVDGEIEEDMRGWLERMYAAIVEEAAPASVEEFEARLRHWGNAFYKRFYDSVVKRKRWASDEKADKQRTVDGIRRGMASIQVSQARQKQEEKAQRLQNELDAWDLRVAVYDQYLAGARELQGQVQMAQFRRFYRDHGTREA